jgi:putative ABC transport system permease protein
MLKNYLRTAFRNLRHHKLFAVINVLGLALGICICLVMYLISSYELSFDRFHPDKDRLYRVGSRTKDMGWNENDVPPPAPETFRKEIAGVAAVTEYFPFYYAKITIPADGALPKNTLQNETGVIITDPEYFSVFNYSWLAGTPQTAMNKPFRVVLSEKSARRYFGSMVPNEIVGRELLYDDSLRVTVSGIVKDWKGNTDFPFTDFISFATIQTSFLKNTRHMDSWALIRGMGQSFWPMSFVKLAPGVTADRINTLLKNVVIAHMGKTVSENFKLQLQPLSAIHFDESYSHDNIRKAHLPTLYAIIAVAFFILIIAAINFINLSTAQSIRRAKEIGVRKVLGSGRGNLILQFLTETLVLCFAAGILGVVMTIPVLSLFREFIPAGVVLDLYNLHTIFFILLFIVVTALIAGIYPARVAAAYLPIRALKGSGEQQGSEKWMLRKGLIVFQFSISLIFIIGVLVIGRQIGYMLNSDLGFKAGAVINLDNWSWQDDIGNNKVLIGKLNRIPGVEKAIAQSDPPMGEGVFSTGISYKGKQEIKQDVSANWGDEDFVPFYQMKLKAGRNISHSDSLNELLINETCLKALGFQDPADAVGKMLYYGQKAIPIVGVVEDFHQGSFRDAIKPLIIGHQPQQERSIAVKIAGSRGSVDKLSALIASVGKQWTSVFPNREFEYSFLDESIARLYEEEQRTLKLMSTAMGVTIFISCMGLFGLGMFTAQRRTKEIGIRKILGASIANIMTLLTRDFVMLVLLALVIASPIAWYLMSRWLDNFAYRIHISIWIFFLAGLSAVVIALVTVSFQAMKAALSNPVKSLRSE